MKKSILTIAFSLIILNSFSQGKPYSLNTVYDAYPNLLNKGVTYFNRSAPGQIFLSHNLIIADSSNTAKSTATFYGTVNINGTLNVIPVPSVVNLGTSQTFVMVSKDTLKITTSQLVSGNVGQLVRPSPDALIFLTGSDYSSTTDSTTFSNAKISAAAAYTYIVDKVPTYTFSAGAVNIGTVNTGHGAGFFVAGVYKGTSTASTSAGGIVTLSGTGDFIFYFNGTLTTGANTRFILTNGATASHVFFASSGAVTTGANSTLVGTFISPSAMTTGANTNLTGRLLSTAAAVHTGASNSLIIPTN